MTETEWADYSRRPMTKPSKAKRVSKKVVAAVRVTRRLVNDALRDKLKTLELEKSLERLAEFVDKHDVIIPELTVRVGMVELTLTGRKLDDPDDDPGPSEKT